MDNEVILNQTDNIQLELNKKSKRKNVLLKILPFTGLVFLIILFSFTTNGSFLTSSNLTNLVNQSFTLVLVAVGAAFIYAAGMMDISIGAVVTVAMLVTGILMGQFQINAILGLLIGIVVAVGITMINSLTHLLLRVPIFIISLCVLFICNGIAVSATEKQDIYIDYFSYQIFNTVPIKLVVLLLVIAIGYVLFNFMSLGKSLKAIGGNAVAAHLSGVKRFKSIFFSFVVMGVCLGLASFFELLRSGKVDAQAGGGIGLNIIVALVLGGFPLAGGANAKLFGPIIGALMVTVLNNGLTLEGLNPAWANAVKGLLFMIVVGITYEKSKGKLIL